MERPALQLRFGTFILDLSRSALFHGERQVPLRRQTFDTLRHLVEREGQVVSKEDLVQARHGRLIQMGPWCSASRKSARRLALTLGG